MKSTQNNQNKAPEKKGEWQIPERSQVFLTPGAQKTLEDAERQGKKVRIVHEGAPGGSEPKRKAPPPANTAPAEPQKSGEAPSKVPRPQPQKKSPPPEKLTLKEAIIAELRDRLRIIRLSIQVNSEDIIRGAILGAIMILFALLQTTFFVRFAPFGKVPDLMLVFVLAVGVCEGEKWGAVFGLVAAFVIQSLGSSGMGPELLPLVYMPAGCVSGLLSKYYLRHTLPVMTVYVAAAALLRGIVTVICASFLLKATLGEIILRIAVPEYFSTLVVSPIPFLSVWLSTRSFHKTRAERTDTRTD
ncbi:MAG: ECF transporter S component [Ruminococcaceae bacterium]|nr:ECF transporter S component [Oscillospiraceae bacterium]